MLFVAAALMYMAACADAADTRDDAEPAQVVDTLPLDSVFARAERLPRLHSLIVARGGDIVREAHYRGPGLDAPANIKSAGKSIISALVGIAIAEGALRDTLQPIAPFFADELRGDSLLVRKQQITIGHLLSMQSGLEPTSFGNYGEWVSSSNWVRNAVRRPMVADPGGRMLYSTGTSHLLSAILTEATGRSTLAYAREKLFSPMDISLRAWTTDPQGIYFG